MEKILHRIFDELLAAGMLGAEGYLRIIRLVTLLHPSQLADVMAAPGESLFISSEGIAEFFHSLLCRARECGTTACQAL